MNQEPIGKFDPQPTPVKQPYQKPRLETIPLVLEEAVLGVGCKSESHASAQGGGNCVWSGCIANYGS
jgi:hypothetical protein